MEEIDKESFLHFKATVKETEDYYTKFKPMVENWTMIWERLEIVFDNNMRQHMDAAASQMLLDWAKVTSSIKDEM